MLALSPREYFIGEGVVSVRRAGEGQPLEQEDAKAVGPWQSRRLAGSDCLVVDSAEEPHFDL